MTERPPGQPTRSERARDRAVKIDSSPRLVEAIDRLRRRLPGDPRLGDDLSTAGRDPVALAGRELTALEPDRPSAVQGLGLGALQLWQALSEKSGRGHGDRPVAILFTDLVDFSKWALEAGDELAVELLREVGTVLSDEISAHDGDIVKRLGDGLMAVFDKPQDAVEAALEAIAGLATIDVEGHTPRMRAGIHCGTPRRLGGDYLGVDVNIAARVGEAAGAGELLASLQVVEQLDAERFDLGRAKRLRAQGAPSDLRICRIRRP